MPQFVDKIFADLHIYNSTHKMIAIALLIVVVLVLLVYFNVIPMSKIKALLGKKSTMLKSDQSLFMKLHNDTLSQAGKLY